MKVIFSLFIISLISFDCFAGTLVKYYKNTGDIIQTNKLDKMPSQKILNDRFRSAFTDIIFVEEAVDIITQRVDINNKSIIGILQNELDLRKEEDDKRMVEEVLIQKRMRKIARDQLIAEGRL